MHGSPPGTPTTRRLGRLIAGADRSIQATERRYILVKRALRDVEAQHPEVDVGPIEAIRVADPELVAEMVESGQYARRWWDLPDLDQRWRDPRVIPSREVARYGRFRVEA